MAERQQPQAGEKVRRREGDVGKRLQQPVVHRVRSDADAYRHHRQAIEDEQEHMERDHHLNGPVDDLPREARVLLHELREVVQPGG